jgi:hypothetical protein
MKPVARIITRDSDSPNDGLIIGIRLDPNALKKGRVYEISEVLEELVIKDIGPSAIKGTMPEYEGRGYSLDVCWGNSVDHILDCDGKWKYLTEAEASRIYKEKHI